MPLILGNDMEYFNFDESLDEHPQEIDVDIDTMDLFELMEMGYIGNISDTILIRNFE
jgi:hypothetical protein